jgi:hypothetical protein
MKLDVLISGLNNPQPAVRLDVVRVLGMLDETRALEPLRQCYKVESEAAVRSAIAWAGKRLYGAKQAGYSTVEELFQFFGVYREIENMPDDATEAELMQEMQRKLDADILQMKQRSNRKQLGMAAAAGLAGYAMGGVMMGTRMTSDALSVGAGMASSSMEGRPQIGTQRTPATAPSNAEIGVWVKRLRESKNPAQREQAAIELGQLNNPAALPYLAAAFVGDPSPQVQQAAQRFGKQLYWSAIYWDMEQTGELQREIERRAVALGKNIAKPPARPPGSADAADDTNTFSAGAQPAPDQPDPEDVREILRQAKAARKKRKGR